MLPCLLVFAAFVSTDLKSDPQPVSNGPSTTHLHQNGINTHPHHDTSTHVHSDDTAATLTLTTSTTTTNFVTLLCNIPSVNVTSGNVTSVNITSGNVTSVNITSGNVTSVSVTSPRTATKITWYKDGAVVNRTSGRVSGGSPDSPALLIVPALPEDGGSYLCTVSGLQGTLAGAAMALTFQGGVAFVKTQHAGQTDHIKVSTSPLVVGLVAVGTAVLVVACWSLMAWGARKTPPSFCCCRCRGRRKGAAESRWNHARPSEDGGRSDVRRYAQNSFRNRDSATRQPRNSVLLAQCIPIRLQEVLAMEWCEDMIDPMDEDEARELLLTVSQALPIQAAPHLTLHSPCNWDRVADDSAVPCWCTCGQCVARQRKEAQVCCGSDECLTKHPLFVDLCLKVHVLEVAAMQDLALFFGERRQPEEFSPTLCQKMALRIFMLWQWGEVKERSKVPIPSCVAARIAWAFPDETASPGSLLRHRHDSATWV